MTVNDVAEKIYSLKHKILNETAGRGCDPIIVVYIEYDIWHKMMANISRCPGPRNLAEFEFYDTAGTSILGCKVYQVQPQGHGIKIFREEKEATPNALDLRTPDR